MAFTKPTDVFTWATGGSITTPSGAKQTTGWAVAEKPPAEFMNWLQNGSHLWLRWLNERLFDGAGASSPVLKAPDTEQGDFYIQGGTTDGTADQNGGQARIAGGESTGSGFSFATLYAATAGGSGTATRTPEEYFRADGQNNSNFSAKSLGVGIASPSYALHVQGTGINGGAALFESTDNHNRIFVHGSDGASVDDSASVELQDGTFSASMGLVGTNAAGAGNVGDLRFGITGVGEAFRVDRVSLDVGIGTVNPSDRLHVAGAGINGGKATFESTTLQNAIEIKSVDGGAANDSSLLHFQDNNNAAFIGLVGTAGAGSGAAGDMRFLVAGNIEAMRIAKGTRYLGILTDNPATPLDVNGVLTADYGVFDTTSAEPSAAGDMARRHRKNSLCAWADVTSAGLGANSWGFALIARTPAEATGDYTLTFSAAFGAFSNYVAIVQMSNTADRRVSVTRSAGSVRVVTTNDAGTKTDQSFKIIVAGDAA